MATIKKVTPSLAAFSPKHFPLLSVFFLPPSFPPFTGRRTLEEAAGKADAKSSYDPRPLPSPPSHLLPSLSALYLIDTCSLVNPGLPPGTIPHGSVTNVRAKHAARIQSSHHTHIIGGTSSLIPQLTVKMKSNFCNKPVGKDSQPPNGLFEDI